LMLEHINGTSETLQIWPANNTAVSLSSNSRHKNIES